jgi:hypothetical protein
MVNAKLNSMRAVNTHKEVELWFHIFLNQALDGGEQSASHPAQFDPADRTLAIH